MPTNTSSKYILVVGGAGYIGSHMVDYLNQAGYVPIVLDNLSTGHKEAVSTAQLIVGDIADPHVLDAIFSKYPVMAVMHFASYIQVGESVQDPAKYYINNVLGTLCLLQSMLKWKVNKFIFSSTAAVYGEPQMPLRHGVYSTAKIDANDSDILVDVANTAVRHEREHSIVTLDESHPIAPINPYGHSKRMIEQVLADFAKAYDLRYMSLRYFNAAGAHPDGKLAECHEPETHLIPLILQAAQGIRPSVTVYGRDYPTHDGTCVRDYVHVTDLCAAHLLALEALFAGQPSAIYNLGTGQGYSVQQVIDRVRAVTQKEIVVLDGARRAGDPAVLVANPARAMRELHWQPQYSDLQTIVEHAWRAIKTLVTN